MYNMRLFGSRQLRLLVGCRLVIPKQPVSSSAMFRPFTSQNKTIQRQFINTKMFSSETKACRHLLKRSGINDVWQWQRMCGAKMIHTSQINHQNEDKDGRQDPDDDDEKQRMLSMLKTAVGFFLVPLALFTLFRLGDTNSTNSLDRDRNGKPVGEVNWHDFYHNLLTKGEVAEVIIHSGVNRATVILHPDAVYKGQIMAGETVFNLSLPSVDQLENKIREAEQKMDIRPGNGVSVTYERKSEGFARILSLLVFLGIAAMILKGAGNVRANIGSINPLGKLQKADFTLINPQIKTGKGVKFADVAGLREAKIEVMEFVDCLRKPEKYKELGAKPPKGAILLGPPGCGKTLLAKAVANEASVPFLSMNGPEFIEMIGGVGASRVRNLFAEARKMAPSIIYIDEIDAIGRQRNQGQGGSSDGSTGEAEQTLNQLLVEMDGMGTKENVILLASTNRGDVLDKALLRPGRFDRHITIDLPTVSERKDIFEKHLSSVVLADDKSKHSERLATLTPGFSGADIANVVNEAALHAARELQEKVEDKNLEYAIERVVAGPEKKNSAIGPQEKRIVAYHESGHALVGWMLQHTDALLKVTILPRTSQALGFAQYTPVDKKLYSPEELLDRMCMALGGRVAESLTFNKITTGASNDLEKVTKMAYAQIRDFGFNEAVGLLSFEPTQGKKMYSKRLAATMDLEARQLIASAYKRTEECLIEHKEKLEQLSELLLQKETLNYNEVEALLGPPPFGKKHLVSPVDFEHGLDQQVEELERQELEGKAKEGNRNDSGDSRDLFC